MTNNAFVLLIERAKPLLIPWLAIMTVMLVGVVAALAS